MIQVNRNFIQLGFRPRNKIKPILVSVYRSSTIFNFIGNVYVIYLLLVLVQFQYLRLNVSLSILLIKIQLICNLKSTPIVSTFHTYMHGKYYTQNSQCYMNTNTPRVCRYLIHKKHDVQVHICFLCGFCDFRYDDNNDDLYEIQSNEKQILKWKFGCRVAQYIKQFYTLINT